MKTMLIAGNWKMNTNIDETEILTSQIIDGITNNLDPNVDVLICPPSINLSSASKLIKDTRLRLGAQNCHYEQKGAYTGETSISMLTSLGCSHVILGHSERRSYFGETNQFINLKVKAAVQSNLFAILCIGETKDERDNNKTWEVLESQLFSCLIGIDGNLLEKVVIAYEPVWAIGTGLTATNDQIQEAHARIKNYISEIKGIPGRTVPVLYGGSLNEKNALEILSIQDVNGGLIGGASLTSNSFLSIINSAQRVIN
ncbi:MAG: triose-phosphate isomerase [Candidatus Kapabacteria bacterium]|nr:triose-phosphate isomerase [Candidatus Kapabacteria bacterium]